MVHRFLRSDRRRRRTPTKHFKFKHTHAHKCKHNVRVRREKQISRTGKSFLRRHTHTHTHRVTTQHNTSYDVHDKIIQLSYSIHVNETKTRQIWLLLLLFRFCDVNIMIYEDTGM